MSPISSLSLASTRTLHNGVPMPRLGLGLFRAASGAETQQAVREALGWGYRHFDTARIYGNEGDVGEALRESDLPRNQLFVTTKLWNADHGYERALKAFEGSRRRLGLEQVDLFLLHWPVEGLRHESWRALERLLRDGRVRAIGVSNFTVSHLEALAQTAHVKPMVNQVELHPFLPQRELVSYCESQSIVVTAYSPLTKGERLGHPVLASIAKAHEKTPAQVLIRWALEQGLVCIPKSVQPARLRENAAVFDFSLSAEDRTRLLSLEENFRTSWDPTDVP